MFRRFRFSFLTLLVVSLSITAAKAHYLWVVIDAKSGDHGAANIYFEEGPAPGDGEYLDPVVERGTTWIRTVDKIKPAVVKTVEKKESGKRWLSAPLMTSVSRSVDSYVQWGVYRYGKTDVLLHYYARSLDVRDHDDLHTLARAEQMDLDLVLHEHDGSVEVKVVWKGKPVTNRRIQVVGPKRFKASLTTDEKGTASFKPTGKGTYRLKTSVEEDRGGTADGKEYQKIRHTATMLIALPLPTGL